MTVTVEYFAQARTLAGQAAEVLDSPADLSFRALLQTIAQRHPALSPMLFKNDEPSRTTLFSINDVQVRPGENPEVHNGDRVTIVPPISGGQA